MIPAEILRLIAAYRSCDPEDAEAMLYALMRERGPTIMLPFLFDLHGEAKLWAASATTPELEAMAEAAIDQLDERPSGRKLRVHRALKALQALQPKDMAMLLDRLAAAGDEDGAEAVKLAQVVLSREHENGNGPFAGRD